MNQPRSSWEAQVTNLQKRLEELAIEKEMLLVKVQKAYTTLEQIKGSNAINK